MRTILAFLFAFSVLATPVDSAPLEALWQDVPLWELTPETFELRTRDLGFRWTSDAKDSSRSAMRGMTFAGCPVVECIARFAGGKITTLTASFYTRGDTGEISKPEYEALVKRSSDALTSLTRIQPQARGKDSQNAVKAEGLVWHTARTTLLLEYAINKEVTPQAIHYRPEFVRVELSASSKRTQQTREDSSFKLDPKSRVRHLPGGDVRIDGIPMVDQGEKGYCIVASAERVLRYYGMRVDQNELAQLASSDSRSGTSFRAAMEGLKKAGVRMHFRVRVTDELEERELDAFFKEYNKRALKVSPQAVIPPLKGMIDLSELFAKLRPDLLKEAKLSQRAAMGKFQRATIASVDAGQPMIWCVQLGLVNVPGESAKQGAGGHARLIIGYNSTTNELLYSDSWGAGHELKRMSMDEAWVMHQFSVLLAPW